MPHRPLGAVCCEASERAHKRMNNRAPTRPKPRPKRDPDPDPNQAMPTVHSHVISSIVFCLPCLLRGLSICDWVWTGTGTVTGSGIAYQHVFGWLSNGAGTRYECGYG